MSSFKNATTTWYEEAKQYGNKSLYFVLVGNKLDLNAQREVSFEEAQIFAESRNILNFEVSAKQYGQTKEMFEKSIHKILLDIESEQMNPFEENNGV